MRLIIFTFVLVAGMIMAVQGQNQTEPATNTNASNDTAADTISDQNDTSSTDINTNQTSTTNATSPSGNESINAGNSSENATSPTNDNSTLIDETANSNESQPTDGTNVNNTDTMDMTNSTDTSTNDTNVNDTDTMDMTNSTDTSTNDTNVNDTDTIDMTNSTDTSTNDINVNDTNSNNGNNATDDISTTNTTNVNETMATNRTDVQETNTTTNMTDDNGTTLTNMTNPNNNITSTMNDTNPTVETGTDGSDDQNGTDSETGCKLPEDLSGLWWSTIWGDVTFTDRRIDAQGAQQLAFECFAADDETGNYILRQLNSSFLTSAEDEVFTCVNFNIRNEDNVQLQILTDRNDDLEGMEPVVISSNETVDFGQICTATGDTVLESDLLRKGREVEGAVGCPDLLLGTFNVTYTGQTASRCPNGATMSSCEVTKTLVYDYTNCNGTEDFAGENRYICVSGGDDHVTTFRDSSEENDFTPFACLIINSTENNSSSLGVLFNGFGCGDRWSTESGDGSADVTYTLDKNDDCPSTEEPDSGCNLTQSILFIALLALVSTVISR